MQLKVMLAIIGLLLSVAPSSSEADDDDAWNQLKSYFEPPAEFAQQFGEYSSPLKFYDGTPVKDAADWVRRRQETLDRWSGLLGKWPGLITPENPRTGPYAQLIEQGLDLHELHALMAPRPFLVSGGSEDFPARWIPLNHSIAVNQLLGATHRVGMTNRPMHATTVESNEQNYLFFEHFLKP